MSRGVLLRVVTAGSDIQAGEEFPLGEEAVTIGRHDDCTIVLKERNASRRHARIEHDLEGYRLRDLESANGVFVDGQRTTAVLLKNRMRIEIASTVFEFVTPSLAAAAPAHDEGTVILELQPFVIRIVESKGGEQPGKEFRAEMGVATVGRAEDSTVCLTDRGSSRRHARIEAAREGCFRVVDVGSANGVWLGDRKITDEVVGVGDPIRVGDTVLECRLPETEKVAAASTMLIGDLGDLMAKEASRRLEAAGEAARVSGAHAALLDDADLAYYVVKGNVEIFTVTVKDGRPLGARNHFLTVKPGEAFFGMGIDAVQGSGFLASGKAGTMVRRMPRGELIRRAQTDKNVFAHVARCVDTWVAGLSGRLTRDILPRPVADVQLKPGDEVSLAAEQRAASEDGVVWLDFSSGELLYVGMASLPGESEMPPFPVTPLTWVEVGAHGKETVDLRLRGTAELLASGGLWPALDEMHRVLAECEFINKRLAVVDEYQRLDLKAEYSEAAREAAYDAIGAVLAGKHNEPETAAPAGRMEPVVEACHLVGQAMGIHVRSPAESKMSRTIEDHIAAVAQASHFRTRRVVLKGAWWLRDQGPILALTETTAEPVALLPRGPRAYVLVDPKDKKRVPVDEEVASRLGVFGYVFYPSFPTDSKLRVVDLLRFGGRGMRPDLFTILAMGVLGGILGTITPYLTGRMVDSAIPQGERGLLVQFGLGMLAVAVATAAFKITQSIAIVRVQGRVGYRLQAAIWDRLLDLPSGFFRKFGSGDLAERASGIDAMRVMLSRAGIGGILGSLSSVAYVVMMFLYSAKLAAVAIIVTLVLIGFTTVGNYLQLRNQRAETRARGLIASLVLQLITGVAKVRVSAAENHAFRAWAQRFSDQKRIAFSVGQVQNVVATFSASFQVLSMLVIFGAVYFVQTSAPPGMPPPFTTGEFIAFNGAFGAFVGAMQALSGASLDLLSIVPIYERLRPILEAEPESDESKASPGHLKGEIAVSNLNFRYVEGGPLIVKDMTFRIRPGEMVAFVGSSGCGKSTLLRLLLGFERPQKGAVYYDGQDLGALDVRAVRQQLGVVLQESRVLPTDIYRNIAGTSSYTLAEAWEAAEMAGLAEDIREMPMGMHTVVSEGGSTFSGGQRQRLLIARALVSKPRLIFFDEATSALDNRTQAVVTQSMDCLDATRIVIAHRLSTIVNADRIFYLDGGEIREEGSYEELMAKNGLFAALARRQIA